jgi:hypothetical protein
MTEDHPQREDDSPASCPARPADEIRLIAALEEDQEGGDPVCWAHLVCDECGAISAEGHRAGCSGQPA